MTGDAALVAKLRSAGVDPATLESQLDAQLRGALHLTVVLHLPGGHTESYCVFTPRRRTTWCAVTVVLRGGQLTAEGVFTDAPRSSGAIAVLSGAGAFEGVRGSLTTNGVARPRSVGGAATSRSASSRTSPSSSLSSTSPAPRANG